MCAYSRRVKVNAVCGSVVVAGNRRRWRSCSTQSLWSPARSHPQNQMLARCIPLIWIMVNRRVLHCGLVHASPGSWPSCTFCPALHRLDFQKKAPVHSCKHVNKVKIKILIQHTWIWWNELSTCWLMIQPPHKMNPPLQSTQQYCPKYC